MITRFYALNSIMTALNTPSSFDIDGINYPFSLSASITTADVWKAMDSNTTSTSWAWTNTSAEVTWVLSFESLQELSSVDVVYWLRGNNGSTGVLYFEGWDGSTWVNVATLTATGGSQWSRTINFSTSIKYLRFRFRKPSGIQADGGLYNLKFYLLYNQQNINFDGVLTDDISIGLESERQLSSTIIDEIEPANRLHNNSGLFIDDIITGIRNRDITGLLLDDINIGMTTKKNIVGIELDGVEVCSDAGYRYILTVTPTHQHKSMPVAVILESRSTAILTGRYSLALDDVVIIPVADTDELINNIEFIINPSQLVTGLNKARLNLFYTDGSQEYLDFEVVKEESKRTVSQRLFRDYDGGFEGYKYSAPKISMPEIYPSWTGSLGSPTVGLIKTTDSTRMSLSRYMALQGVTMVGSGITTLVSFDKGTSWNSFINNAWANIDISNIATSGMTVNIINAITLAQFADVFKPTSIDFAVCFNPPTTRTLASGAVSYTFSKLHEFDISHIKITRIDINAGGSYGVSATMFSNIHPSGYSISASQTGNSYIVPTDEIITKIVIGGSGPSGGGGYSISGIDSYDTYLKSITVNMTPSPFTGYAFIL